ncbi:SCJ1 [Symbiodinium pilosum]|uniref:SCJ1 protein n=1 Tax=Symbiodinium pilosum TaxID=2952 RepID=A0A812KEU7_SYMPI|nr:SCJ1 [Symbiodinium pilosum]
MGSRKVVAPERARPTEIPQRIVDPTRVTDIFLDFDGTLTASNQAGVAGYVLPLLEPCRHLRISDALENGGTLTWGDLDLHMAAATAEAVLDFSDSSMLGSREVRRQLQGSLETLVSQGLRLHVLTMGTPQTCKALLAAGGYDVALFSSFLGPTEMARNQGLRHLFASENGSFQFDVQEDIDALHHLQRTGEQNEILQRIMSMEKQLSKADLILSLAGQGGVLVDDNYGKNIFDARAKDVMYIHVDPEGVVNTSAAIKDLAELIAGKTDVGVTSSHEPCSVGVKVV